MGDPLIYQFINLAGSGPTGEVWFYFRLVTLLLFKEEKLESFDSFWDINKGEGKVQQTRSWWLKWDTGYTAETKSTAKLELKYHTDKMPTSAPVNKSPASHCVTSMVPDARFLSRHISRDKWKYFTDLKIEVSREILVVCFIKICFTANSAVIKLFYMITLFYHMPYILSLLFFHKVYHTSTFFQGSHPLKV